MKISTKFNLFVGFFFFFVIMAVLYSYCGGLNVCYSFPFLNGIGRGSVSKAKAMMTSYIIDEKGGSRGDATDTIYFYGKIKGSSNKIPKVYHGKENWERKPHERKKAGSSSDDPPSDITGKVADEMLRKANISFEESNRELYREEKVDKKVDKEDLKTIKSVPTQSTPIARVREDMGSRVLHSRVHPIRKPPRKLKKKKLLKNRMNRLAKQDLARQNIERSQKAMRMHEDGHGKQLQSRDRMSVHDKINRNQTKEKQKNYVNEAVSPYDALKHRNEALTYTRQENETKRKYETLSLQINAKQSHNGAKINSSQKKIPEKKLVSDANKSGSHGNESVTSSGVVPLKRNKLVETRVDEVSGSGEDSRMDRYSLTTGELIMSIGNIKEKNVRLALQSALEKDEQQLQNDVMKIKNSYQEIHKPFNLTSVLKELVKAAESADKKVIENAPGSKQGRLVMKRRDNDRPLIRVKRLGKIKRRNKDSERTLVRVKRIEEDDAPRNSNKQLDVQVKRLDSIDDDNVLKTVQKRNLNSGQKETQRMQSTSEEKDKVGSEVLLLKRHKVFNNFSDYKQKDKGQNAERVRNTTMAKLTAELESRQRRNGLKSLTIQNSNQNYPKNILKGKAPKIISSQKGFRNPSSKSRQDFLARTKRVDLDDE